MKNDKTMTWEDAVLWLREQPEHAQLVRDCFFDDPLIEAAARYYASTEWRAVRGFLPSAPGKALDLGAGRGICSYALARDGWETVALDPDPSCVVGTGAIRSLAEEAGLRIEIAEMAGEELAFSDETFDLVFARQVLHHARDLGQLCREVSRVLKQGGTFIATREHVLSRRGDLGGFLEAHALHRFYGGEHAYLLDEYVGAIEGAGIKLDHVLNTFETNINLFPETMEDVRGRLAKRLRLPTPKLVPDKVLGLRGSMDNTPGRLYTFVGRKTS